MTKRIIALSFIFAATCVAWYTLGVVLTFRTENQDLALKREVGNLWGSTIVQKAPTVYYTVIDTVTQDIESSEGKTKQKIYYTPANTYSLIESSNIKVNLNLEHRKKGLQWYPTYKVNYTAEYEIKNRTDYEYDHYFSFSFPSNNSIYSDFKMMINDDSLDNIKPENGVILEKIKLKPGETKKITISYNSQGMDKWFYDFGDNVSQIKNFNLVMMTDFDDINFPENSLSPGFKKETANGWELKWEYQSLISGIRIGMEMPQKLNPGPFVSRVTFFAPVSLFLFFFLIFIITTLKRIDLHPMNYFFLAASFFSFHILLAYLVDHVNIHLACLISSVVSLGLVISYMRLVVGERFAFVEIGLAQFIYLILFSYAFFLEGYTGLAITICCILTLFVVMQATAKINWSEQFESMKSRYPQPPDLNTIDKKNE